MITLLTIATNGLAKRYGDYIATHQIYAHRHGYSHIVVTECASRLSPAESAWLKIPLIEVLLTKSFVFYLDADTRCDEEAPPIETVIVPGKHIYMAHGVSGRFNSGVIFATGYAAFFRRVRQTATMPIPHCDAAPYENGHVIHWAKSDPLVHELDNRWNNTSDPDLQDYIRHFTGPLRSLRPAPSPDAASNGRRLTALSEEDFSHRLLSLAKECLNQR